MMEYRNDCDARPEVYQQLPPLPRQVVPNALFGSPRWFRDGVEMPLDNLNDLLQVAW